MRWVFKEKVKRKFESRHVHNIDNIMYFIHSSIYITTMDMRVLWKKVAAEKKRNAFLSLTDLKSESQEELTLGSKQEQQDNQQQQELSRGDLLLLDEFKFNKQMFLIRSPVINFVNV